MVEQMWLWFSTIKKETKSTFIVIEYNKRTLGNVFFFFSFSFTLFLKLIYHLFLRHLGNGYNYNKTLSFDYIHYAKKYLPRHPFHIGHASWLTWKILLIYLVGWGARVSRRSRTGVISNILTSHVSPGPTR